MQLSRAWFAVLLLVGSAGCGSASSEARVAFEEARYPDASALYRALEGSSSVATEADRAEYALYRGLSHLAMGDARSALRWLREARGWQRNRPALYDEAERGRLAAAWQSLGKMPGER